MDVMGSMTAEEEKSSITVNSGYTGIKNRSLFVRYNQNSGIIKCSHV